MSNPFLKRLERRGTGYHGQVGERRKQRSLGAVRVPASGSMAGAKGDMKKDEFLIENKTTIHQSYALNRTTLHKISKEALTTGRKPVVALSFVLPTGASLPGSDWIIMRQADWLELLECSSSKKS